MIQFSLFRVSPPTRELNKRIYYSRGGTRGWLHGDEDHTGLTMMTRHKMAGQRAVFPGDYNRNLFPLFGKRIIYAIFWLYEVVLFTLF